MNSVQWTLYVYDVNVYTIVLPSDINNINILLTHTYDITCFSCSSYAHHTHPALAVKHITRTLDVVCVFLLFDAEIVTTLLIAQMTCLTYFKAWLLQWYTQLAVYWNGFCYIIDLAWLLMALELHVDLHMALKEVAVKVCQIFPFSFLKGILSGKLYFCV